MKFGNKKLDRPLPGEYEYSVEELNKIETTKLRLQRCEEVVRSTNRVWCEMVASNEVVPMWKGHSVIMRARYMRRQIRRTLREARAAYFDAVVPFELRMKRVSTLLGGYIRERLDEPSFLEQILPVEK